MRNFLALLFLVTTSLSARANIVITPNVSVIENDTTAFVTVDIQGRSDAGNQSVGFYGFTIALPSTATSIVAGFTGQQDPWINSGADFGDQNSVVTGVNATYTVGPGGFGPGSIPTGRTITGTNSQIGQITFQVARTATDQPFTLIAVASAAPLPVGAMVVGGPNGFFADQRNFDFINNEITGQITSIPLISSGGGFTVNAITAVPEPTSLMLLGFAGSALMGCQLRRRRSRTAPKDAALSDE